MQAQVLVGVHVQYITLSVHSSVMPSVHSTLTVCMPFPFVCICLVRCAALSLCLSVCLCVCLSVTLSVCLWWPVRVKTSVCMHAVCVCACHLVRVRDYVALVNIYDLMCIH